MLRVYVILFFLTWSTMLRSQAPAVFFSKFGGTGKELGYGVCEAGRRTYGVVGLSTSYSGSSDVFALLVDSMGSGIWQRTYGGPLTDVGKCIVFNPVDSGFVVAGYSNSSGNGGYDVLVMRLNRHGEVLWERYYGTPEWDYGHECIIGDDGNIYVCGESYGGPYRESDGYLLKIDLATGAKVWDKYYGGPGMDGFARIKRKHNGNLLIGGNTVSGNDSLSDCWLLEIDILTGDSVFSYKRGVNGKRLYLHDFMEDRNKNLIICGERDSATTDGGSFVGYIIKVDSVLKFLADQYIGGASNDPLRSVCASKFEDYFVFARSFWHGAKALDLQVIRLDKDLWFSEAKDHGDDYNDEGHKIIALSDSGYAVVGYRTSMTTGDPDLYLLKLDKDLSYAPLVVKVLEERSTKELPYYYERRINFSRIEAGQRTYSVFDAAGNACMGGRIVDDHIKLPPDWPPGIYILRVYGDTNFTLKFVVD